MKESTQLAFGIPVWDLHSCDVCASVLLANGIQKHMEWHQSSGVVQEPKVMPKNCPVCGLTIDIPLDIDGSMMLDIYDDHIESHEE